MHQGMLALRRICGWMPTTESETLPPRFPAPPRSRFESLPTELRLQIYSLLLDGKPENCHFNKSEIGRSYSTPKLFPAILAVNRSISAEAYPVLYGENTFLFLGPTRSTDQIDVHQQFLSRLAGLPKPRKPSLLPEHSRHLIKHVAAAPLEPTRNDWAGRLLELAPATKTIEFDFWVGSYQTPNVLESWTGIAIINASIPAIKSLITTSTQIFSIGTRDITAYHDSKVRFSRRKHVELPGMQLAVVDLEGIDKVQEKSRMAHKALIFIIEIMGQKPPLPNFATSARQSLVSVEPRLRLHRNFAGFWFSDTSTVPAEYQGWRPVDTNGQSVEIGSECKGISWRRSGTDHVKNRFLYGYSGW